MCRIRSRITRQPSRRCACQRDRTANEARSARYRTRDEPLKPENTTTPRFGDDEKQLIERCRAGERAAQFALFNTYKDGVYGIALRMTNDPQTAEDLAQKSFMRVFDGIGRFRGESGLRTWIFKVTTNTCINHLRKANRWRALVPRGLAAGDDRSAAGGAGGSNTELRPHLEEAIAALPAGYRMVFVLHDIEGYNHQEIGEMLDIATGTSKSQLHKARKELRAALEPVLLVQSALR